jgi:hypothetical protein
MKHLRLCLPTLAALLIACCWPAHAATLSEVVDLRAGANAIFFGDADPWNADAEAALNGSASLSPHITLVGSIDYGFSHAYFRSTGGARITATDVDDPNFSIGLGIQYHTASVAELRPDEWCPEIAVGWRPWPASYPRLSLTALGWYGLETNRSRADVGVRYRFNF